MSTKLAELLGELRFRKKAKARGAEQKARDQRAHDLRHLKLLRNEAQNLRAQQDQRKIQQKVIRHIDFLPNSLISIQILPFHFARLYSNFFFLFSTVRITKETEEFLHSSGKMQYIFHF